MQAQLDLPVPTITDDVCLSDVPDGVPNWLTRSESRLAKKVIDHGPSAIPIWQRHNALGAVDRLISRGFLGITAFTPQMPPM